MITYFLRDEIDSAKIQEFEHHGRLWLGLVNRLGGRHHGYLLPSESASDIALASFTFPSMSAYDRTLPECAAVLPGGVSASLNITTKRSCSLNSGMRHIILSAFNRGTRSRGKARASMFCFLKRRKQLWRAPTRWDAASGLRRASASSPAVAILAIWRSTFRKSKAGYFGVAGVVSASPSRQTAQSGG